MFSLLKTNPGRVAAVIASVLISGHVAAAPLEIGVWPPGKMPGHGAPKPEMLMPDQGDKVDRITDVSVPTLTLFPATAGSAPHPAMIVCPGGAYGLLSMNKEGTEIAAWLNTLGISAMVLKYRVPNNRDGALQDIERAVRLVRSHEADWKIDPKKVGVIGFSAGGHLAVHLSTTYGHPAYEAIDAVDQLSCRSDFDLLVYPAYLDKGGAVDPGLPVSADLPPTFMAHSEDDPKFVTGSKLYHAALDAAKVPNQFELYVTGGHGYGLRCTKEAKAWPQRATEWLVKQGIITSLPGAEARN